MQEVLQFLKDNAPFYVATFDGGLPHVRPFGFVMEFAGKLWFSTNNKKEIYQQLKANPYLEISTTSPEKNWIRLKGIAVFNSTHNVKARAVAVSPKLASMYTADDPIFEVFYLDEAEATFYSMAGGKFKTVKL